MNDLENPYAPPDEQSEGVASGGGVGSSMEGIIRAVALVVLLPAGVFGFIMIIFAVVFFWQWLQGGLG
jgi:hypothetical protein